MFSEWNKRTIVMYIKGWMAQYQTLNREYYKVNTGRIAG